jgi:hypothetical protein
MMQVIKKIYYAIVQKKKIKFGVIHFAVSVKVSPGFKVSVFKIKESQWHLLFDKEESTLLTAQEWAEVCYVPEWVSKKKGNADYRFIARNTMENLSDHPAASSSMTFISKFCSVGLAIYDDRMGIFNDGGLLLGVTVAQIKKGFSKLRNPLIADV